MVAARLLESRSHIVPGKLKVTELIFEVPKDYSKPAGGSIRLFARSATRHELPAAVLTEEEARKKAQKPWFVYLQGGPGGGCDPPQDHPLTETVVEKGYQMLYLDQRGTGLSCPITAATLALQGDVHKQAEYLKLFRADNIVNDCEAIRKSLTADYPDHLKKWSSLGQSYGGFCTLTYLSKHPEGLREAFLTGGLAPVGKTVDEVYTATYKKVIERNQVYSKKYPEDIETVHNLVQYIESRGGLHLPSGGLLTVRAFLLIGRAMGFHGYIDAIHNIVLRMKTDLAQFEIITRPTLSALENSMSIDNNVIYGVLHEPLYMEGAASSWSAERVGKKLKEFHYLAESPQSEISDRKQPIYFYGEMMFPFMFDVFPELKQLREVANILAEYSDWPALYDKEQLAKNEVPLYSATYIEDMFVDFGFAQETASLVRNCKQFITNMIYHDGLRRKHEDVMKELFKLRDDPID